MEMDSSPCGGPAGQGVAGLLPRSPSAGCVDAGVPWVCALLFPQGLQSDQLKSLRSVPQ